MKPFSLLLIEFSVSRNPCFFLELEDGQVSEEVPGINISFHIYSNLGTL